MRAKLAIAIVVVLILVIFAVWYAKYRYGTFTSDDLQDGTSVGIACNSAKIALVSATYRRLDGTSADVTAALRKQLSESGVLDRADFVVSGKMLGQPPGGYLSFRYRCAGSYHGKAGFLPIPMTPCAVDDAEYGVDMTSRNAAGTVVWVPWSQQSRVSLQRDAETPEVATPSNPVTGIGKTSMVRKLGDRYRHNEELAKLTVWDTQPGHSGYMQAISDGTTKVPMHMIRGPNSPAAPCNLMGSDGDDKFYTDGFYDDAVLSANGAPNARLTPKKEGFTSTRPPYINSLVAARTGLGSVRQDPRFEPGPDERVPGGDASWSPGDWAGGPTTGAYAPDVFAPPSNWYTTYVAGFGDPNDVWGSERTAEVVYTEPETWTR
jgi:hypothetical protein